MRLTRGIIALFIVGVLIGLVRDSGLWNHLAMPVRVARLYTQPPDLAVLMPVAGVKRRAVANTWDAPRPGGRKHQGQDIFARKGTPVLAASDGVVSRLGGGKLGGNAVFVAGRGGRVFYYAHLDRYAEDLAVGRIVSRGDVLGYVGNTGNARTTAAHLHFSIYTPTGPIDPLPLIESASSLAAEQTTD